MSDTLTTAITVLNTNDRPVFIFTDPAAGVTLSVLDSVLFRAAASDVDDSALVYRWYYDGALVAVDSSGADTTSFALGFPYGTSGTHSVRAEVDDGDLTGEFEWTVTVNSITLLPNRSTTILLAA